MADDRIAATTHFTNLGQMSVRELPGAIPYGETAFPLMAEDVAFEDQRRSDASMLKEMNMNREESESFIVTRGLIGRWNVAEIMLRAWVDPVKWKGSDQFRSHLGIPLVAEQFYSIHSVVNQTLFGGYKIFQVDPTADTPIEASEAQQALLQVELKTCGFKGVSCKTEFREITFDGLFYGFGVAQYGWETTRKDVIKKVPRKCQKSLAVNGVTIKLSPADEDDLVDEVVGVCETNMPKLEHVPIRRFRYAPDLRRSDARTAEWCGRLIYLSGYQLDSMRNTPGWNIPSRTDLVKLTTPQMQDQASTNPLETLGSNTGNPIFQQTTTPQKAYPENYTDKTAHDPLMRKFECFDYWTGSRHAISLNKEYVLLNETHNFKRPPFLSFAFRVAPDAAHGYGIAYWLTDFQRVCQGVINAYLDDMNLNLMGTYTSPAGTNNSAQAQWIFPGKVFKSDAQGEFKAMTRNAIEAKEPLEVIAQMKSWASSVSGAGISTMGSNPGSAGDVRTPGGVEALSNGEQVKLKDLIDVISEQVFVPFLEFCIENNQKLKPSQIRAMLSQSMGNAFRANPIDLINGTYKVEISAGAKLASRDALNRYLTIIETMIQAPGTVEMLATQAMKLDFNGMLSSMFDSFGVPYRQVWIQPQTDEDKVRSFQRTQAAAAEGKMAQIQAQGEIKKGVDDNQAENRMLIQTGKHVLDQHGVSVEQAHEMQMQKQEQQTPEAQGFARAAKSAFANIDKGAFGS
jgi:hypothetical protein